MDNVLNKCSGNPRRCESGGQMGRKGGHVVRREKDIVSIKLHLDEGLTWSGNALLTFHGPP